MADRPRRYNDWLIAHRPRPQAPQQLVCFPYAGGSAGVFRTWSEQFSAHELCAVTLPGREHRFGEPLATDLKAVAQQVARGLLSLGERPRLFFGHSLGALLAFETARELRRLGAPMPLHLFVSACGAPHIPDTEPHWHCLNDEELAAELRKVGATDEEVLSSPELRELMFPMLRADGALTALRVHQEEPPLEVPITAFHSASDPLAPPPAVERWREHTSGRFTSFAIEGGHMFVSQPSFVRQLAALVERAGASR
jgi:medium-chain acyl-[acyl-carrier-protein] hydrolase